MMTATILHFPLPEPFEAEFLALMQGEGCPRERLGDVIDLAVRRQARIRPEPDRGVLELDQPQIA